MKDLAGKTAFVTGAASGIGLGIATALAQAGVKVMMADIEKDALDKAISDLRLTNADVEGVIADVSLKDQLQAAADATIERFGKVHILVNNAGVGGRRRLWPMERCRVGLDHRREPDVGRLGVRDFWPADGIAWRGGQIVSTASMAGLVAAVAPAYNVTKYGVVALSEGLRQELAPRGIGVSVLCPGFIRTKIMESGRNLPGRFASQIDVDAAAAQAAESEFAQMAADLINKGIDPLYVGELVREAIEEDWPYILTDTMFEAGVDERFAAIKAGFDRIRDRTPRH